jgi:hypothetical protein
LSATDVKNGIWFVKGGHSVDDGRIALDERLLQCRWDRLDAALLAALGLCPGCCRH